MQERGVSTRVSVKFEQVNKDGSFKADPKAGPAEGPPIPRPAVVVAAEPDLAGDGEPAHANGNGAPHAPETGHANGDATPNRNLLRRALAGMRETASQPTEN
jgi:hypothetical protein